MDAEKFKSAKEIKEIYAVSSSSLRNYGDSGKIEIVRSPGGKRFYNIQDVRAIFGHKIFGEEKASADANTYCYARVSSKKQEEDLTRQIEFLQNRTKGAKIIHEVGSGLNFHRKGLQSLIRAVIRGKCKKVVITYRDRICRYGFELLEFVFKEYGVEILVLNENITEGGNESEFARDILDICNYYVASYNGKKSALYRKNLAQQKNKGENSEGIQEDD